MQTKDKINKHAWGLLEGAIDNLQSDLVSAVNGGQLKLDKAVLPTLLSLTKASIEAGYHKGSRVFERSVQVALDDHVKSSLDKSTSSKKK